MSTEVKHSGAWRTLSGVEVKHSGAWRDIKTVEVKHGGTWRTVYQSGPTVDIKANGRVNFQFETTCYSGEYFLTSGNEYEYNAGGGGVLLGSWLTSGNNSDVWVSYTRTAGTATNFNSKTSGSRYQLGTNQYFQITALPGIYRSITVTWNMYDAASGGNLLDSVASVGYVAESESSGCPLCCFTPDTGILLESGIEVPIKDIREGDEVLTANGPQKVGAIIAAENVTVFKFRFEDDREIHATPDHPFHTERGPASVNGQWYKDRPTDEVNKIRVGDRVWTSEGKWLKLVSFKPVRREPITFTFDIEMFYANGLAVY